MPTGIGTALLIGGIASAGASVAGGAMASKNAKNAAKTQTDAADKAAALNQSAWQQQQELQRPYLQAGRSAVTNLGALMTPGQPYTPAMQQANVQGSQLPGPWNGSPQGPPPPPAGIGPQTMQRATAGATSPFSPRQNGMLAAFGGPGAGASGGSGGDTVLIEAPDGSSRQPVPRAQAQFYISKGGRVVG